MSSRAQSTGLTRTEYDHYINELAGKELSKRDYNQFFKPPPATGFNRYFTPPSTPSRAQHLTINSLLRTQNSPPGGIFKYETEWGRWNRLKNSSPLYDPQYSKFIDQSVGIFTNQTDKQTLVNNAKKYELLSKQREQRREKIRERLDYNQQRQTFYEPTSTSASFPSTRQASARKSKARPIVGSLRRHRHMQTETAHLEPFTLSIHVNPLERKRPVLPK